MTAAAAPAPSGGATVLVVEDELPLVRVVRAFLEDAGYTVETAADGVAGIARFRACRPDLVLLDVMLPKVDGFAVCEVIRAESRVPVMMLTALDDDASQMRGFDVLADDYVTKPFSMPLVLRRIEALLRRAGTGIQEARPEPGVLRHGDIVLDPGAFSVRVGERPVALTAREFAILKLLMSHPGRVFTRDALVHAVWGDGWFGDARIVNTHVKNIRRKLGVACIETVRGVGYRVGGDRAV